ncbi:hypothetical protein DFJ43DRAFT_319741 [Lentinula guzmanii]|uniref:Uncharacterized protein n=1 Tax=Lentinula guzmanii TaxID=2804957 RepID=A0AA38J9L7_9AGAR|nr:hypothetical protein DFJ43DRAFT_319741 [Lentinula guzmanii]
MAAPQNHVGLMGLICVDCLFFFSTQFWPRKAFNVFIATHISWLTILIFAVSIQHASVEAEQSHNHI